MCPPHWSTKTFTESLPRSDSEQLADELLEDAELPAKVRATLLDKTEAGARAVRLLGAGVHNLESSDPAQPATEADGTLFQPQE